MKVRSLANVMSKENSIIITCITKGQKVNLLTQHIICEHECMLLAIQLSKLDATKVYSVLFLPMF